MSVIWSCCSGWEHGAACAVASDPAQLSSRTGTESAREQKPDARLLGAMSSPQGWESIMARFSLQELLRQFAQG